MTTAPAPMKANRPIVIPQSMVAFAPIVTFSRTKVGKISFFLGIALLGLMTFVKTQEGPQKTLSSRVTPSYTETLFWIFTLFPMIVLPAIPTCPAKIVFSPIFTLWAIWTWLSKKVFLPIIVFDISNWILDFAYSCIISLIIRNIQ